jgi:hypothetical protein
LINELEDETNLKRILDKINTKFLKRGNINLYLTRYRKSQFEKNDTQKHPDRNDAAKCIRRQITQDGMRRRNASAGKSPRME